MGLDLQMKLTEIDGEVPTIATIKLAGATGGPCPQFHRGEEGFVIARGRFTEVGVLERNGEIVRKQVLTIEEGFAVEPTIGAMWLDGARTKLREAIGMRSLFSVGGENEEPGEEWQSDAEEN